MTKPFLTIAGQRFGRLVTKQPVLHTRPAKWLCVCDCGVSIEARVSSLNYGSTKSCGCLRRENAGKASTKLRTKHGHTAGSNSRTYRIWANMMSRCTNPNFDSYPYYGGRGIAVTEPWKKFANFLSDMGKAPEGMSLDRIESNGNYSKENCRWATKTQQANNMRSNVRVQYLGESLTVQELCRAYNLSAKLMYSRLARGWDIERAVATKAQKTQKA